MDEPKIGVTRRGEVPTEGYGQASLHWLVSKKTNGARELTVGLTTIPAGGNNPLHRHPNCEEALYVLSGEIDHYIEGTPRMRMTAGDTILVPRNAVHQAFNVGKDPAELLVSFSSPERETVLVEVK